MKSFLEANEPPLFFFCFFIVLGIIYQRPADPKLLTPYSMLHYLTNASKHS